MKEVNLQSRREAAQLLEGLKADIAPSDPFSDLVLQMARQMAESPLKVDLDAHDPDSLDDLAESMAHEALILRMLSQPDNLEEIEVVEFDASHRETLLKSGLRQAVLAKNLTFECFRVSEGIRDAANDIWDELEGPA